METITFTPPQEVVRELELLVQRGRYPSLAEAMIEAARLLVQREMATQALAQILTFRQKLADWQANVTQAVVVSHEEKA